MDKFFAGLLVVLLALLAVSLYGYNRASSEQAPFVQWCIEQGGTPIPSDGTCVGDGQVLVAPRDRDARWP